MKLESQLASGSEYVYLHFMEEGCLKSFQKDSQFLLAQKVLRLLLMRLSEFSRFYSSQSHLFGFLPLSWRCLLRAGPPSFFPAPPRPAKRDWQTTIAFSALIAHITLPEKNAKACFSSEPVKNGAEETRIFLGDPMWSLYSDGMGRERAEGKWGGQGEEVGGTGRKIIGSQGPKDFPEPLIQRSSNVLFLVVESFYFYLFHKKSHNESQYIKERKEVLWLKHG